eukprot:TRINITY_DN16268_c1_g1_i3.p1 TRINITY_DN16268_c1_g1~~TRINITY_DN16268_c1_g1_i3.p1  ORF type:complete len:612 (+),score=15.45 TRINITY_DN16268_c1_g1_i3:66-1838(+)
MQLQVCSMLTQSWLQEQQSEEIFISFVQAVIRECGLQKKSSSHIDQIHREALDLYKIVMTTAASNADIEQKLTGICNGIRTFIPVGVFLTYLTQLLITQVKQDQHILVCKTALHLRIALTELQIQYQELLKQKPQTYMTIDQKQATFLLQSFTDLVHEPVASVGVRCGLLKGITILLQCGVIDQDECVVESATRIADILSQAVEVQEELQISALECLQSFLCYLQLSSIPIAQLLVRLSLSYALSTNVKVQEAAVSLLISCLQSLSSFVSPFIEEILSVVISTSLQATQKDVVMEAIASSLPPRGILPPLQKIWKSHSGPVRIVLGGLVCKVSAKFTPKSALQNLEITVSLIQLGWKDSDREVNTQTTAIFMSTVLKLGESAFKQMFIQLMDWALNNGSHTSCCFLFACSQLFQKLKSILKSYCSQILDCCLCFLKGDVSKYMQEQLDVCLGCMQSCYQVVSCVDLEMEQQWNACANHVLKLIGKANDDSLVSCSVSLVAAAQKYGWWKTFLEKVYGVMCKGDKALKKCCLKVVNGVVDGLGNNFHSFVLESLSFLMQVQEDPNEDIFNLCQEILQKMERISSDPFQNIT